MVKRIGSLFLLALIAITLSACPEKGVGDLPIPPAGFMTNSSMISTGQKLFAAHCAECHGSLAEGRTQRAARLIPFPPDFHERRYRKVLPGYLYRRIERGGKMEPFRSRGSVMPAWKPHLSQRQIWALVAYIHLRALP